MLPSAPPIGQDRIRARLGDHVRIHRESRAAASRHEKPRQNHVDGDRKAQTGAGPQEDRVTPDGQDTSPTETG